MNEQRPAYNVYLVRLWQVGSAARPAYRIALERPGSAERQVFGDLHSLSLFFEEEAARLAPGAVQPGVPPDG